MTTTTQIKKTGRPTLANKKRGTTIKLPPWLREKLRDVKARDGLSQAALIEKALCNQMGWSEEK